ncbi:MAG TPA: outer membrane lipoprotein chaperone LolA [Candidatus Methylomirabilis sp.]|nr:outer membrane lipoprotein chaperone LolA [Candidatus Methylomirabilis sp.]
MARPGVVAAAAGLVCLGIGLTWNGAEAAPSLTEVVDKVRETCMHARDLSARFEQITTIRSLNQEQRADGILLLKRPRKMRWEYQKPEPRLFVTDGKTLWAYSPADKQVVVQEVGEAFASRLPISILAGDCQLRQDFEIGEVDNAATRRSAAGFMVLDLRPKRTEAGVTRMLLEVNLKSYTIERITVFDASGNTNVYRLSDLKLNPGLPDQQFTFTPPPGVTVVTPPRP